LESPGREIREWKNPQDLRSLTGQSFFLDQTSPKPAVQLVSKVRAGDSIGMGITHHLQIEQKKTVSYRQK
jgi:hypothetical protein